MLIIAIATAPDGAVTHYLMRADVGTDAYHRLQPLLTPRSQIDTCSVAWWAKTRGELPQDLRALDQPTPDELGELEAAGGRLIDPAPPPPTSARTS